MMVNIPISEKKENVGSRGLDCWYKYPFILDDVFMRLYWEIFKVSKIELLWYMIKDNDFIR